MRAETPMFAQMMYRCAYAWGRRVADGDAEDLADMIAFRDELDDVIRGAIAAAQADRTDLHAWGWRRIASVLGKSLPGTYERYNRPSDWTPAKRWRTS